MRKCPEKEGLADLENADVFPVRYGFRVGRLIRPIMNACFPRSYRLVTKAGQAWLRITQRYSSGGAWLTQALLESLLAPDKPSFSQVNTIVWRPSLIAYISNHIPLTEVHSEIARKQLVHISRQSLLLPLLLSYVSKLIYAVVRCSSCSILTDQHNANLT